MFHAVDMPDVRVASTPEEREAVQRFRYTVYVEELGRYRARADHDRRVLVDPEDEGSWLFYLADADQIVASTRISWGGAGFSERQIAQYGLAPFLAELPHELLAVGERLLVASGRRSGELTGTLLEATTPAIAAHGVQLVFGACEPHLLSRNCAVQFPYAERNINSPEAGYLIPLLSLVDGTDALVGLGDGEGQPRCVAAVLAGRGAVRSPLLGDAAAYVEDVTAALVTVGAPVFAGLAVSEVQRCLERSNVIRCAEGDRILKRGGAARSVFVVLDGSLEVSDGGHPVAALLPGDLFGETAFLLHRPRTHDVDVLCEGTTLLCLSERTLRSLAEVDPVAASKLYSNISRMLSARHAPAQ